MREARHVDLWENFTTPLHRIGISTNGYIKRNGQAVMGRGCAKQLCDLVPGTAARLGVYLKRQGNTPGYLILGPESGPPPTDRVMILPVKHNWYEKADLELVSRSVDFLISEALAHADWTFHVPRLGCGNGRLSWEHEVRAHMQCLPDNCVVHS
jgi:hypothetical protein